MNTENKEKSQLLREALESANGICRSAYQIAHRISTDHGDVVLETNFGAFKWRCKESLAIQHRVMFPEQYGEDRLVRAKDGPLSLEETVRILGADGHYRLPVRPVSVAHARSMIDKMQSDDAAAIEALIGGNTITQLACEVLRLSRSISNADSGAEGLHADALACSRQVTEQHTKRLRVESELRELRTYAVELVDAVKNLLPYLDLPTSVCDVALTPSQELYQAASREAAKEQALRWVRATIAKYQCGGSGSLTETSRPSTAHPLPAALKAEKQLDGGPSACGPTSQPEPRTNTEYQMNSHIPFVTFTVTSPAFVEARERLYKPSAGWDEEIEKERDFFEAGYNAGRQSCHEICAVPLPAEPTEAMLDAGREAMFVDLKRKDGLTIARKGYKAMLAAAPQCVHGVCRDQQQRDWALRQGDVLADWCNRSGKALKAMMDAYERRIRSLCSTPEQIEAQVWRCAEFIQAERTLTDKPVAVVEIGECHSQCRQQEGK